jgi:predicted signal transduction protein with EAL and GGDEF domain
LRSCIKPKPTAKAATGSSNPQCTPPPATHGSRTQALRRAIHNNDLALHYQPVVSIRTGQVVALEALARWHHPTKGNVAPIDFIPLAEETGLIIDIGRWARQRWLDSSIGAGKDRS